jgi:hypothetical protein
LWSPIAAKAEPDPACDPIFAAITKLLQTPNHQFMSQSSATDALNNGGRLRTSESISTADASYIKVRDHWLKVPLSPQDMLKQQEDGRREAKESCHYLRDDDLEGNAALYTAHTETPKGTSDVQMWISKTTGLPVREEVDLDFSEPGKSHSSIRFDYEHVELPKELQ